MFIKHLLVKGFAFVIAGALSQGCSNNFVTTAAPNMSLTTNQGPEYFPLNEGFRTTYEETSISSSSSMMFYTVGKTVPFQGTTGIEWIKSQNGHKDTSIFVQSANSLIFYERKKSAPKVILNFPLSVGKTWSRFESSGFQIADTTQIENGIVDKESGNSGASLSASFPIEGEALMTVDKIESIELKNGSYFSGVYRVSNDAAGGTRNYYWYAPGIGLIKYMHGASNPQNPSGGLTGELITYGYKY